MAGPKSLAATELTEGEENCDKDAQLCPSHTSSVRFPTVSRNGNRLSGSANAMPMHARSTKTDSVIKFLIDAEIAGRIKDRASI